MRSRPRCDMSWSKDGCRPCTLGAIIYHSRKMRSGLIPAAVAAMRSVDCCTQPATEARLWRILMCLKCWDDDFAHAAVA